MFIKQISVFLENQKGALRELTEVLGKAGIDLMALSIADTQSFGIVRTIMSSSQIDQAAALLRENGYIAKVNHVICAAVPDRPLGLSELLAVIEKSKLSVEYMYSFLRAATPGTAHMILRLDDGKKAEQVFELNGIVMLGQEDVDKM